MGAPQTISHEASGTVGEHRTVGAWLLELLSNLVWNG
jgi:hypothetical protein